MRKERSYLIVEMISAAEGRREGPVSDILTYPPED